MSLVVEPGHRHTGVGGRLLEQAAEEARAREVTMLQVAVMTGNDDAISFYGRAGFTPGEMVLYRDLGDIPLTGWAGSVRWPTSVTVRRPPGGGPVSSARFGQAGTTRRPSRGRGLLGAALAAATAAAAAGCGSSTPGVAAGPPVGTPRAVVLASVGRTQSASTATISLHVSISGTPDLGALGAGVAGTASPPVSATITGSGAFDFGHKTGELTLQVAASATAPSTTVDIRLLGNDLYLSSPKLAALDGGKPWIHVDASAYTQRQSQSAGALGGFQGGDPTKVLDLLQKLTGTVSQVGPAQVDGVSTTHYRATVNLAGPSSGTGTSQIGQGFAKLFGFGAVPVDVWVDSAGRARRVEVTISLLGITAVAGEDLGDFGAPVVVTAPPASQVADGTALVASGQLKNLLGGSLSG